MISSVMAHLKTKETRNDAQARKEWKFRLTRRLYEQGYERQHILNLFRFLDWTLELPEGLKQAFQAELAQYEQERQMPYITSIEQMAKEQERKEIALRMQQGLPIEAIAQATQWSIAAS
ncbi:hypothetical protein NIES2135_03650 [Leptolyngbya boryana NIES-2135]|jgi:hypothetical protein|uniref:Uncharacterized protein n=1 Tax=Leptolyngbya boryana NIES-2135 TaxID=1973484 RepID=A0A1Z4J9W2_LEPBY|nr:MULTISPECIES: hypothetical protein [Leptolyngbya]BAY53559.1 hypothetical protein NIES2135_03650 [Leptolyngbya boryana NIES-2135]MBD2366581.1 hypothetical protein [Leptolyngbya sp. FACHB-161]MBD2373406.1 hypothetical protein [Leptolyngbya sp. FACHB-238]MBD2397805.1 hypothetical protein [Leptolyngbya sp. FACHB-239]MBD2407465.1 hypothetical protein [Leptolyngbya sp. FACHB-402]